MKQGLVMSRTMGAFVVALAATALSVSGADASPPVHFRDGQRWVTARRSGVPGADGRVDVELRHDPHVYRARVGPDAVVQIRGGRRHVEAALRRMRLELIRVLFASAGLYQVRSRDRSEDGLDIAARLVTHVGRDGLEQAAPDLALPRRGRSFTLPPNDPRYGGQWYLKTLEIEKVWQQTAGDPAIEIGVVDNGCDLAHPDLVGNLLPGKDVVDGDDTPSYAPGSRGNEHGTACAGIIAAVGNNGKDIVGICPTCRLRCVRLLPGEGTSVPISADIEAFRFQLEKNLPVSSNSWGFGAGVLVPATLKSAIQTYREKARGGLGAVVVFAAGNDSAEIDDDELQAIEGVITVGAVNHFDEASSFSNRGRCVALTAPAGTLTLDISGAEGAKPGDVTDLFGGTSSAAPVVAGVAALLFSRAPDAPAALIREVLIASARPAPFAQPDANGHDRLYGYGIVDPAAALAMLDEKLAGDGGPHDAGATDASPASGDGADDDRDEGGCCCSATMSPAGSLWLLLPVLGAWLLRRRAPPQLPPAAEHRAAGRSRGHRTRAVPPAARASLWKRIAASLLGVALLTSSCAPPEHVERVGAREEAQRPDTPGGGELPPRFEASEEVLTFDSASGLFRVHYSAAGANAVPPADLDQDQVPDYVQMVADRYDAVAQLYHDALGYRSAVSDLEVKDGNGGDGRFDVYLLDFAGSADGAFRKETCQAGVGCAGYMVMENDFKGYAYATLEEGVEILSSHEYFHAVQAAYVPEMSTVLAEGTAVWATERFVPHTRDLESFAAAYLARPERSLATDPTGPVQSFAYGSALFFWYIADRYGEVIIRQLHEALASTPTATWTDGLDGVLKTSHGSSFSEAFIGFGDANVTTGRKAMVGKPYTFGASLPRVTRKNLDLPTEDPRERMYPAAARYYRVAESGEKRVATTVLPIEGARLDDLAVVLYEVDQDRVYQRAEATSRGGRLTATLDIGVGREALVAIIDGRSSGASRKVSLCVVEAGSPSSCDPATPAVDGGGAGDGASGEGGGSGGCALSGARQRGSRFVLMLLGLLVLLRRRRPRAQMNAPG